MLLAGDLVDREPGLQRAMSPANTAFHILEDTMNISPKETFHLLLDAFMPECEFEQELSCEQEAPSNLGSSEFVDFDNKLRCYQEDGTWSPAASVVNHLFSLAFDRYGSNLYDWIVQNTVIPISPTSVSVNALAIDYLYRRSSLEVTRKYVEYCFQQADDLSQLVSMLQLPSFGKSALDVLVDSLDQLDASSISLTLQALSICICRTEIPISPPAISTNDIQQVAPQLKRKLYAIRSNLSFEFDDLTAGTLDTLINLIENL